MALLFACLWNQMLHTIGPIFMPTIQNDVAIYAIDSIEIIAGSFQIRQQRLVEAWAEIHQEELLSD